MMLSRKHFTTTVLGGSSVFVRSMHGSFASGTALAGPRSIGSITATGLMLTDQQSRIRNRKEKTKAGKTPDKRAAWHGWIKTAGLWCPPLIRPTLCATPGWTNHASGVLSRGRFDELDLVVLYVHTPYGSTVSGRVS